MSAFLNVFNHINQFCSFRERSLCVERVKHSQDNNNRNLLSLNRASVEFYHSITYITKDPWCHWWADVLIPDEISVLHCILMTTNRHAVAVSTCTCFWRTHTVTLSQKHIWMCNMYFCHLVKMLAILTLYNSCYIFGSLNGWQMAKLKCL